MVVFYRKLKMKIRLETESRSSSRKLLMWSEFHPKQTPAIPLLDVGCACGKAVKRRRFWNEILVLLWFRRPAVGLR
jgi:hypothetical protein